MFSLLAEEEDGNISDTDSYSHLDSNSIAYDDIDWLDNAKIRYGT